MYTHTLIYSIFFHFNLSSVKSRKRRHVVTIFSWKEPIVTEYYSRWNIGLNVHTVVGSLQRFLRKDVSVTGTNCMAPDITAEAEPKSQELHTFASILLST